MTTKLNNYVLNLVNPAIDDLVLLHGAWDNSTIGSNVPAPGWFTNADIQVVNVDSGTMDNTAIGANVPAIAHFSNIYDTALNSPLVGAITSHLLSEVFIGYGLAFNGNTLYVNLSPAPSPPPPPPPPGSTDYILREDNTYVLREDTSKIVRET